MSKLVMVCLRRPRNIRREVDFFLRSLCPDNLAPEHAITDDGRGLYLGVYRPLTPPVGQTAHVGWLREDGNGSYALFKGGDTIELVADATASRTIWIAATPDIFVASTSQTAIPYFLGSLELNQAALGWMLASGCSGPGTGWDTRARPLGPYGRASFDRRRWTLKIEEPHTDLEVRPGTWRQHRARIEAAVDYSCKGSFDGFALCLSGGRDSRNIVQRMNVRGVNAITWGTSAALDNPTSDAVVARRLAERYGVEHRYFATDWPLEPVEKVLDRFVHCSEARIDHIRGYTDGFALWKQLADSGVRGVVRGDNLFGCSAAWNAERAAAAAGLLTLDSLRPPLQLRELGIEQLTTRIPSHLVQRAGERARDWYHRLMHGFRHPTIIAALNEIKSAYVEVANPLNINTCVEVARSLPSELRDYKRLFNSMADNSIPFARDSALAPPNETLASLTELLADELMSARTANNFGAKLGRHLADRLGPVAPPAPRGRSRLRRAVGELVPARLRYRLTAEDTRRVSARRLALRVYLTNAIIDRLSRSAGGMPETHVLPLGVVSGIAPSDRAPGEAVVFDQASRSAFSARRS